MTDLVFHKSEKYIEEDLEYYFSGERDIHSQVKPGQEIYSFTPNSDHLNVDFDDKKIGNLFFPFAPGSLDRIYIGISFPLFANNWGAAFLSHLMTLVKPDGCVVLPVYPEMQAAEKNYWSRSILENIFISRSRWKGMSNIWAENDGVMSMRIGRQLPPEIHSTATYLLKQGSQAITRQAIRRAEDSVSNNNNFLSFHSAHWQSAANSAIIEKIIQDHFGRKKALKLACLGDDKNNGLLAIEALLSPYINIEKAYGQISATVADLHQPHDIAAFYSRKTQNKLVLSADQDMLLTSPEALHVLTLINELGNKDDKAVANLLKTAWQKLSPEGLLIVHESPSSDSKQLKPEQIQSLLASLGTVKYYSSIAASERDPNVEISHYSLIIEQELRNENTHKEGVFWIVQK